MAYVLLACLSLNDPFYGDAKSTISRLAHQTYSSNFSIWLYPQGMDPGHPVTFPMLHTLLWKAFGKKLFVSHLFVFVFTLLNIFLLFLIDKKLNLKGWLILLVAINPIFIALNTNLSTHIILTAFFLGYYYAYLNKNNVNMNLFAAGMLITHNQGMLLLAVFWISSIIVNKNIKHVLKQLPALAPWLMWLFMHKSQTGWFLFPPEYAEFRGLGSAKLLLKNAAIILWRLIDFGLIAILILAFKHLIKSRTHLHIFLIAIGAVLTTWLSVKFSIAHRYFIFTWIILSIPAAMHLMYKPKWLKAGVLLLILSGSFWYYPGKQLSDANIQYRHFFKIYHKIQQQPEINKLTFFSTAPNESSSEITHLSQNPNLLNIKSIAEAKNWRAIDVIMHGNVCGPLPWHLDSAVKTWHTITIQSGPAWVNIHSKDPFNKQLQVDFPKRKPSWFEIKLKRLKAKYK